MEHGQKPSHGGRDQMSSLVYIWNTWGASVFGFGICNIN